MNVRIFFSILVAFSQPVEEGTFKKDSLKRHKRTRKSLEKSIKFSDKILQNLKKMSKNFENF